MEIIAWEDEIRSRRHVVYDRPYDDRKMPIVDGKDYEFDFHERLPNLPARYDVPLHWIHDGVHEPDGSDVVAIGKTRPVETNSGDIGTASYDR
jgi:hypothetical protein